MKLPPDNTELLSFKGDYAIFPNGQAILCYPYFLMSVHRTCIGGVVVKYSNLEIGPFVMSDEELREFSMFLMEKQAKLDAQGHFRLPAKTPPTHT